jgi:hypothetical protein
LPRASHCRDTTAAALEITRPARLLSAAKCREMPAAAAMARLVWTAFNFRCRDKMTLRWFARCANLVSPLMTAGGASHGDQAAARGLGAGQGAGATRSSRHTGEVLTGTNHAEHLQAFVPKWDVTWVTRSLPQFGATSGNATLTCAFGLRRAPGATIWRNSH